MTKINKLLEGLNEKTRVEIQEAWDTKLVEAREELTAELREEFAQRYDHDKKQITEAVEKFVSTKISAEITELAEDKKIASVEKVKYRKAVNEHSKILNKFVVEQVAKEVRELHTDRKNIRKHIGKLDNFVTESLAGEITEFYEDKKNLTDQRVKMLREGKKALAIAKRKFIGNAATLVENTVNKAVTKEIQDLREDITRARENDFGRRLFESFAQEYGASYLNSSKEMKILQNKISGLTGKLSIAKTKANTINEAYKDTKKKARIAEDRYNRTQQINKLLKPLGKEKKEIMSDLLESVKTVNLEDSFNKYLPSVLGTTETRNKTVLKESVVTEHNGNRQRSSEQESAEVVELATMRKLAGLS